MSYNELYEHKRSDTIKWVLTLIAFIVVGVLLAGLIAGWFDKKEELPAVETEQATVADGSMSVMPVSANGIRLMAAERVSDVAVSPQAETSYTITATIEPAGALQKADWSLAWANGSSSWASGKTVTDYVTVSTAEDGALTATLSLVKPFSEQIILTVAARGNSAKTATCTVDYQQRLVINSLKMGDVTLSTETCNLKVDLFERYYADLDFTYSEGTMAYLGEGSDGFDEFICGGIAFTDEFISAYNSLNGSGTDITRKMNRGNLSSSVNSAKEFDFDAGAAGQGVFNDLLENSLSDTTIGYLRAAVNQVGEDNVFKFGIFKSTSAIADTYVECDTWYKIGFNAESLFSATNSISVNQSGVVF